MRCEFLAMVFLSCSFGALADPQSAPKALDSPIRGDAKANPDKGQSDRQRVQGQYEQVMAPVAKSSETANPLNAKDHSRVSHQELTKGDRGVLGFSVESWIAIFTAVLAFATFLLWHATRSLVKSAEETARKQLRAYLMIPNVTTKDSIAAVEIVATIPITNFGQTPAHACKFWIDYAVGEYPLKTKLQKDALSVSSSVGVVAPTSTFSAVIAIPRNETPVRENTTLYIFGNVEYFDVFNNKRSTEFRFYKQTPWNEGEWLIHEDGNDAT